jgi:hypothetical protein
MSSGDILQCHQVIYYNVIRLYTTMSSGYIIQCHQLIYFVIVYLRQNTSSEKNPEENIILIGPGPYTKILTGQCTKILSGFANKDK